MSDKRQVAAAVAASVFGGMVIGILLTTNLSWMSTGLAVERPAARAFAGTHRDASQRMFVGIARQAIPAVVSITSEKVVKPRSSLPEYFPEDDFFKRFFRFDDRQEEYRQEGLGSGVIVDPKGYIMTNYHVIKDAEAINVLFEGRQYSARVVGTDPPTDVAVLRIDRRDLPSLPLGDSDGLEIGEWVLAIGSPFSLSLEHTVTAGIISAKGRSELGLGTDIRYQDFIQTDAAINPGNSGGALVNLDGELIGINTAIIAGHFGGNLGIGFAIPVNMARKVMDELIAYGQVVRGYLGAYIKTPDAELSEALGLSGNGGAVVVDVETGSPAERAGLERYDTIVAVDGQAIGDDQHLSNLIADYGPGTRVRLDIVRDGRSKKLTVILEERPETRTKPQTDTAPRTGGSRRLGLAVAELTEPLAERYGYTAKERGVLVTEVEAGSPAEAKGITPGDLIIEVNRTPIRSVHEFEAIVGKARRGQILLLQIKSRDTQTFVAIKVE